MPKMDDMRAGAMYVGRVLEIGDPANHFGWVKITLSNRALMSHPIWCAPAFHNDFFWMPNAGDLVFVFFESGSWVSDAVADSFLTSIKKSLIRSHFTVPL